MSAFELPNWTQIPNFIIDEWMSELTHAEFKILMLILRYTVGYHRRQAKISFRHFEKKCGVTNKWIQNIITKFEELGWIKIHRGDHLTPNTYEILIKEDENSKKDCCITESYTPVVVSRTGCSSESYTINKDKEKEKEIIIKEDTLPPPPDPIDDDDFFRDKSQDPPPPKEPLATALYPCLDKLDLNPEFKKGIPHMKTATGQRITKELIEKAVAICLERLEDIGCVEAYFTKIIKNPEGFPDMPKKCDIVKENKKIAQRYQAHINDPTLTYDISPEYVEIGKYPSYEYVHLDEMNFEGKLKQALAKRNITLEE